MKLLLRLATILIVVLMCFSTAFAEQSGISLVIDGVKAVPDSPPVIQDGRTLLPAGNIFEALGVCVAFDYSTQILRLTKQGMEVQLKIDSNTAKLDGREITMDVPPALINGCAYIPLRFICENFDMTVSWDGKTNTAFIEKEKNLILAPASATVGQAQAWARKRGATELFISLAPYYWDLCKASGVDPAVAYAQAAKETGFGRFGGVLDESFHNPCGFKTNSGGSDSDPNAHMRFPDWPTGIQAHIDHLALYAGASGYPKKDSPDPRHFSFILGRAKTVEDLGGKWAPSLDYGNSLVYGFLNDLRSTPEPEVK